MLKINEYKERYNEVRDTWIRHFLKANPVRKLVDFEDPDNANIEFVTFYHEYVSDKQNMTTRGENELIVEYIELDRRFFGDQEIDLLNEG